MRSEQTPPRMFAPDVRWKIPAPEECRALWDAYDMFDHIREHSEAVAAVAYTIALRGAECGLNVNPDAVLASALLHDIAKTYTILHGGDHAQLGAAWTVRETGNPHIAQGVMHHVWWPWEISLDNHFLPMAIIYADKRVRHENIVSLAERYSDLMDRYGKTERSRQYITLSLEQAADIERVFTARLEIDFNAYSFGSGRLV